MITIVLLKLLRHLVTFLLLLTGTVSCFIDQLPEPTGLYSVGTTTYFLYDHTRIEQYAQTPNTLRQVIVHLYYPANPDTHHKHAQYQEEAIILYLIQKGINIDHYRNIKTNAFYQAPIANDQSSFPVIIFSPGFGCSCRDYSSLLEELASHGYIIAALDHPYTTITVNQAGNVIPTTPIDTINTNQHDLMCATLATWIADTNFIVDQLKQINMQDPQNIVTNRLKLDKLGIFGHSLGGAVALHICALNHLIKAAVNIDGALLNGDGTFMTNGLDKPYMILVHDYPELYQSNPEAVHFKTKAKTATQAYIRHSTNDTYHISLNRAEHFTFSDAPLLSRQKPSGEFTFIEPRLGINITRFLLVCFFNHYIKSTT